MTTKTQTTYEAVKAMMLNGIGKVEAINRIGKHIQNVRFTDEQNQRLKEITRQLREAKSKVKFEHAKELIESGYPLYKAYEKAGINVTTITKEERKRLSELKALHQKSVDEVMQERFEQTVELLKEGLTFTASGQVVGFNPTVFMNRLNDEQRQVINSLKGNYKKMGKKDISNFIIKVEKVEDRILTEKEEQDLIEGNLQIGFKKSEYIIGLVKRLFPSDPTTSIDEKGYLMAGKKGFWKISNKAWKGVELVEITN